MTTITGTVPNRMGGRASHIVSVNGSPWPGAQTGELSIAHGRETAEDRVAPAALTVTLMAPDPATRPRVGDRVTVDLSDEALAELAIFDFDTTPTRRRFTGRVQSARLVLQRQRPSEDLAAVVELVAVGTKQRLANIPVGQAPWPAELVSDRVARIMAAAIAWDAYTPDDPLPVGTIEQHMTAGLGRHAWAVVEQDVDNQTVMELIDTLAEDVEGELCELRDGTLTWHGLDHRRGTVAKVELAADDVLADAEWTQEADGLVNVWYVPDPNPNSGFTYGAYDPVSLADHGPLIVTRTTAITPDPDNPAFVATTPWDGAAYITNVGLSRRSRPRWVVPTLTVDLLARPDDPSDPTDAGLTDAQAAAVLALEYGDLITLTGVSVAAPLNHARLWVEGWTETANRQAWRIALNVTEYGHTGPAVRWADITPPDYTWADLAAEQVDGPLDWLRSGTWFPQLPQAGRWIDRPPEAAWDDQAALTWQETAP